MSFVCKGQVIKDFERGYQPHLKGPYHHDPLDDCTLCTENSYCDHPHSLNVELKVNHVCCVGVIVIAIKNC